MRGTPFSPKMHSLRVVAHARVQLQDVLANEPHQIAEVRRRRLVAYELQHAAVVHLVHVQRDRAHRDAHHRLRVVEELDRLRVQRKVIGVLVVEEVNGVRVQLQAERLQEQHVVAHDVLVAEVELVHDDRVDVIVAEQIVCGAMAHTFKFDWLRSRFFFVQLTQRRLVADVLEQDVERLQQLDAHETGAAALLPHDVQKVGQHVLLQEEAVGRWNVYFESSDICEQHCVGESESIPSGWNISQVVEDNKCQTINVMLSAM